MQVDGVGFNLGVEDIFVEKHCAPSCTHAHVLFVLSHRSSVTPMEEMGSHSHVCPYSLLSAPRNPIATCVSLPWGWSYPVHGSRKQLPHSIVFVSHCRHPPPTDPALRLRSALTGCWFTTGSNRPTAAVQALLEHEQRHQCL